MDNCVDCVHYLVCKHCDDDHFNGCHQFMNYKRCVEVVCGQWIEEYTYDPDPHDRIRYKCSVCGRTEEYKEPYCNCGAKMDGE